MKLFRTTVKVIAAGIAILMITGSVSSANTLRVGLAIAQTGGLAPFDVPVLEGMQIAVDEINRQGGIEWKN